MIIHTWIEGQNYTHTHTETKTHNGSCAPAGSVEVSLSNQKYNEIK